MGGGMLLALFLGGVVLDRVAAEPLIKHLLPLRQPSEAHLKAIANGSIFKRLQTDSAAAFVVGGVEAKKHEFPSIVTLIMGTTTEEYSMCGGNVIAPSWILTAAHCLHNPHLPTVVVIAGAHNITEKEESQQRIPGLNILIHQHYDGDLFHNDIALIKLSEPLEINEFVQIASIADTTYPAKDSTPTTLSGWGQTSNNAPSSDVLRTANLSIIANSVCSMIYELQANIGVEESMICAWGIIGSKGSCAGDSGGPLYALNDATGERFICGLVSFGIDGGCGTFPGVFTRVSSHLEWIKRYVGDVRVSVYSRSGSGGLFIPNVMVFGTLFLLFVVCYCDI